MEINHVQKSHQVQD